MSQTDQRTAFEVWAKSFSGTDVEIACSGKRPLCEMSRAELMNEIKQLNVLLRIGRLSLPPILVPDGMRLRREDSGLVIVEPSPSFGFWARLGAWWRTQP